MDNQKNNPIVEQPDSSVKTDHHAEVSKISKLRKGNSKWLGLLFLAVALIPIGFIVKRTFLTHEEPIKEEEITFETKQREFAKPKVEPPPILQETPADQKVVTPTILSDEPEPTEQMQPKLVKSRSGVMVNKDNMMSSSENESESGYTPLSIPEPAEKKENNRGGNDIFRSTEFQATRAQKSEFNPNLLLKKGTLIQCSLRTKIVSTIAGNVGCIVAHDIYSANGNVLLIERGSEVFGEFKSGQIRQGQDRIFVIWSEIRTPKNIVVQIDSGATDELGGTGIQGWTDTHFWERFGGAIMLSMIDDVAGYFAYQQDKRNGYDMTESTREATREMAASVIENTINIPPTLYKNHGDLVGIYLARDVDFSDVYQLRSK